MIIFLETRTEAITIKNAETWSWCVNENNLLKIECYMQASPTVCIVNVSQKIFEKRYPRIDFSKTMVETITIENLKLSSNMVCEGKIL